MWFLPFPRLETEARGQACVRAKPQPRGLLNPWQGWKGGVGAGLDAFILASRASRSLVGGHLSQGRATQGVGEWMPGPPWWPGPRRQRLAEAARPQQARVAGAGLGCGGGGGVGWPLGPCRMRCERSTSDEMHGYPSLSSWELCQAKKAMLHAFSSEFTILYQGKGDELSLSNL